MMQPQSVAEVGTFVCGNDRSLGARLVENAAGEIHTADSFGAERCPEIIAVWPSCSDTR